MHLPLVPMQPEPTADVVPADPADEAEAVAGSRGTAWGRKLLPRKGKAAEEAVVGVPGEEAAAEEGAVSPAPRMVLDRTVVFVATVSGFVGGAVSGAAVTLLLT